LGGIGGFGGLFELPLDRYRRPVLVSGTDGVGTKLKLALETNRHDSVGIDLVAMCVNDVLVCGAEPLFFLDYYATGSLDVEVATRVVSGIASGCREAGCALLGGETAEMPGMYATGDYDLAGFCVGVVEHDAIIDGSRAEPGDVLIGLPSSGPHSNGYSLIRRILARSGADLEQALDRTTLGAALMAPTRIYVRALTGLLTELPPKALCHITGGGLLENLPRVLPDGLEARIDGGSWTEPPVFDWLRREGAVQAEEMLRTFNCGIGMVLCVAAADESATLDLLRAAGEQPVSIGRLAPGSGVRLR
jgi:phosphoribosylformylglycinamidine cyclo-ligase